MKIAALSRLLLPVPATAVDPVRPPRRPDRHPARRPAVGGGRTVVRARPDERRAGAGDRRPTAPGRPVPVRERHMSPPDGARPAPRRRPGSGS